MDYVADAGHPAVIARLLHEYGLQPKKGAGQNFFSDPDMLEKIADAGMIEAGDTVLEIGPGLGSLTQRLAKRAGHVVAVELDRDLLPVLEETTGSFGNVSVINGDFLRMKDEKLGEILGDAPRILVVSNLPYNITNDAVQKLLLSELPIAGITLLLQKEAAQRIQAQAGEKQYWITSMLNAYYAESKILFDVSRECFYPMPGVTSSVIRIVRKEPRPIPQCGKEHLWQVAHACIAMRRKTLANNLKSAGFEKERFMQALEACGIDPGIRGEVLPIEKIEELANALYQ